MSDLEAAFSVLETAAVAGARCPENGTNGLKSVTTTQLAHAGRILIEIFAWNYRRITILTGPHAGKATAPAPASQKAWKIIDRKGTITRRGRALSQRRAPITLAKINLPDVPGD